jgi:hypothetical protein
MQEVGVSLGSGTGVCVGGREVGEEIAVHPAMMNMINEEMPERLKIARDLCIGCSFPYDTRM